MKKEARAVLSFLPSLRLCFVAMACLAFSSLILASSSFLPNPPTIFHKNSQIFFPPLMIRKILFWVLAFSPPEPKPIIFFSLFTSNKDDPLPHSWALDSLQWSFRHPGSLQNQCPRWYASSMSHLYYSELRFFFSGF